MHYQYKVLAERFPQYRPWFVYINHAIRNGYTQFKADQLVNRVAKCLHQDQISIYQLTRVLMYMGEVQLVNSQIIVNQLEDDQVIGTMDNIENIPTVYKGRTMLLDKSVDIEQLLKSADQYAYLTVIYTFKDIYCDR